MVKDEDFYMWMKKAEDRDLVVSFKSKESLERWFEEIEKDLIEFGNKEEFLLDMLCYAERLHWITIENEEDLRFQFDLPEKKYADEINYFLKYLSQHSNIMEKDGKYYLKKEE